MKIKTETVFAVGLVLVLCLYMGWMSIPGLNLFSGSTGGSGGTGGATTQSVNKPVRFYVRDKYGGGPLVNQVLSVYTVDKVQVDTLTTAADGTDDTGASYPTGTQLLVSMVGAAPTVERKWYTVTVPAMSPNDAQSLTVNVINLDMYDYTAPLLSAQDQAGNAIADTGNYNKTVTGNTATITVSWHQPTTGDGFDASYDPIYAIQNQALLVMKLSNTNYELVGVNGMDGGVMRGAAMYYYKVIDPTTLTKWQVGNNFQYPGVGSTTFSLTLAGYSGDVADCDLFVYYFADWNYFVSQGNFGPNALNVLAGGAYTINLID